jgi:lipoyl(octanoyl) transferase
MQIIQLDQQPYQPILDRMKCFTQQRQADTADQLWLLEHDPVYTLGQAGKREHILNPKDIPIIQSDRGGQVTYHGPGQLIAYVLMNLQRKKLGVRTLVNQLEEVLITLLETFKIEAHRLCHAPGVYVADKKIASIGLRVKANCTYHGIALNVNMDLDPFEGINPCGYSQLKMTQLREYESSITMTTVIERFMQLYCDRFYSQDQTGLLNAFSY